MRIFLSLHFDHYNAIYLYLSLTIYRIVVKWEKVIYEEHAADHPILFLVIHGKGTVRIGGSAGETREIETGDAVLWPAHIDHTVWTDDEALSAIVINAF